MSETTCCNLLHLSAMNEGNQIVASSSDDLSLFTFHNTLTERARSALVDNDLGYGDLVCIESERLVLPAGRR